MKPEARREQLLVQEVGNEVVLYDEQTHQAHRLNRTAAIVWQQADGHRTPEEIAGALREELAAPDSEDLVQLALAELDRAGLLTRSLTDAGQLLSRRQLFATAAALLPIVASVTVPTSLEAQSGIGTVPYTGTAYNGIYQGTGTVSESRNTCNLGSSSSVSLYGILTIPGRWEVTHPGSGITFTFTNVVASQSIATGFVSFTATGTFTVDGNPYTVQDSFSLIAGTLTGTQTYTRSACTTVYNVSMTRAA